MGAVVGLVLVLLTSTDQPLANEELLKAISLTRPRNYDAALVVLDRLCPSPPGSPAKISGSYDLSCEMRTYVLAEKRGLTDDNGVSELYWLIGEVAYKRGQFIVARALEELALERDPRDAANWHSLGIIYRAMNKNEEAVSAFRRSLEIDPKEPNTMYWLASTLIDVGQLDEAERVLTNILTIDPKHARVWFRRGEIQMIRHDYKAAIEAFTTARQQGVPRSEVSPKIKECERLASVQ